MKWKTNEDLMNDKEVVKQAKCWLCECMNDTDEEDLINELSPRQILRAVQNEYAGGVKQFLVDSLLTWKKLFV